MVFALFPAHLVLVALGAPCSGVLVGDRKLNCARNALCGDRGDLRMAEQRTGEAIKALPRIKRRKGRPERQPAHA